MGYGKLIHGNVIIKDVALVDRLKHDLFNISQFCNKELQVMFDKELCFISHRKIKELALCGVRKRNLFVAYMDITNKERICYFLAKISKKKSWLWHKKLTYAYNFQEN